MIMSCGEALIDMLPQHTATGDISFTTCAGGAVFNTAIALGRLGSPSAFFSGLSNDMLGETLAEALTKSQVDISFAVRSTRPTTLAFVKMINGQATYDFYDENSAGRMLLSDELPQIPPQISTLFFGGISLVNDPAASTYETLQARESIARVTMIDPNIRPNFIGGQEKKYRARINRMIGRADIVKLSNEDLHWLYGDGDVSDLARLILKRGPKIVFVTEGAEGARAVTQNQVRICPAVPVIVADTVGAGDTFNAGILTAFHMAGALTKKALNIPSDALLDAALQLGTYASSVTVSRVGANPPWLSELKI